MKTGKNFKMAVLFLGLFLLSEMFIAGQSSNNRNRDAVQAFERGETFYKKGALTEAKMEYTRAIELESKYAEAFMGRGNARSWGIDANLELAQEDYDKAAVLDRKYSNFAKAFKYFRDGDYTKAIETFDRVIQEKINLMDAYSDRGNSYSAIGEIEKSIADHTEAIRVNPGFYGNYGNRAYLYGQTEQFDKAIADCDKAISLNPNEYYFYFIRGFANNRLENYTEAINNFTKGINLQIGTEDVDFNWYIWRGDSYMNTGDYDKAMADVNTILRRDPANEDAQYLRGIIRAKRAAQ